VTLIFALAVCSMNLSALMMPLYENVDPLATGIPTAPVGFVPSSRQRMPCVSTAITDALVRYDADIAAAADQLRPSGEKWLEELNKAYFALNEDRQYLSAIVLRLSEEAAAEKAALWAAKFDRAFSEALSPSSLDILRRAEKAGYHLEVQGNVIVLSKNSAQSFLYSEADLQRYGRFCALSGYCTAPLGPPPLSIFLIASSGSPSALP
jgi:hypothetical protein